jgi:hypothetical protein
MITEAAPFTPKAMGVGRWVGSRLATTQNNIERRGGPGRNKERERRGRTMCEPRADLGPPS